MKSVEKFQCDKCNRNLWSRDQLEMHVAKCDGSHIERRGRKPGDNCCVVSGSRHAHKLCNDLQYYARYCRSDHQFNY